LEVKIASLFEYDLENKGSLSQHVFAGKRVVTAVKQEVLSVGQSLWFFTHRC
jgi:hypothetical protein